MILPKRKEMETPMKNKGGLYVYCVVGSTQDRHFRALGIDKADVLTISYDNLSMVVSHFPLTRIAVSRDNMLAHERVIERIMREFDAVLPVRFGTIAANADEIREFLDRQRNDFQSYLRFVDHKIELNVKGVWKSMSGIYAEIVRDNPAIRERKERLLRQGNAGHLKEKYEVGMMVEKALQKKKEEEASLIVNGFRKTATEVKINKTSGDEMFLNAAFLVDRGREKEFDNLMDEADQRHRQRVLFKYTGPLPAYNFINVALNAEGQNN